MQEGSPAEGLMRAASHPHLGGLEMQQVPCKLFHGEAESQEAAAAQAAAEFTPHQKEKE